MVASKAIPLMQSKVRCYIDKSMFQLISMSNIRPHGSTKMTMYVLSDSKMFIYVALWKIHHNFFLKVCLSPKQRL